MFQDKSAIIVKLRNEVSHLQELNSSLQSNSDESQLRLSEVEACLKHNEGLVENLELQLCELRSSSDLAQDRLKNEVNLLRQNHENKKRDEDAAKLEFEEHLKNVRNELALVQCEHRSLLKDCEDSTLENLSKILELQNLNKNAVQQLRSKEQELENQSELLKNAGKVKLLECGSEYQIPKSADFYSSGLQMVKSFVIGRIF